MPLQNVRMLQKKEWNSRPGATPCDPGQFFATARRLILAGIRANNSSSNNACTESEPVLASMLLLVRWCTGRCWCWVVCAGADAGADAGVGGCAARGGRPFGLGQPPPTRLSARGPLGGRGGGGGFGTLGPAELAPPRLCRYWCL